MTLGGLALAVGILVDESTVEIENIHAKMEDTPNIPRAVRQGNLDTALPRLLALLCILAVFVPSFFMQGAARALFVPLTLAVGFAMVSSYMLSEHVRAGPFGVAAQASKTVPEGRPSSLTGSSTGSRDVYGQCLGMLVPLRWLVTLCLVSSRLG